MLNATVRDEASVLMSPAPNAARPGPIGINVPIKPKVGPIRVIISVFFNVSKVFSSSNSNSLRANASRDSWPNDCELAISIKAFF